MVDRGCFKAKKKLKAPGVINEGDPAVSHRPGTRRRWDRGRGVWPNRDVEREKATQKKKKKKKKDIIEGTIATGSGEGVGGKAPKTRVNLKQSRRGGLFTVTYSIRRVRKRKVSSSGVT